MMKGFNVDSLRSLVQCMIMNEAWVGSMVAWVEAGVGGGGGGGGRSGPPPPGRGEGRDGSWPWGTPLPLGEERDAKGSDVWRYS